MRRTFRSTLYWTLAVGFYGVAAVTMIAAAPMLGLCYLDDVYNDGNFQHLI